MNQGHATASWIHSRNKEIPDKLMQLHQQKLKNKLYDSLMTQKSEKADLQDKLRLNYMALYLLDSGTGKVRKNFDKDKPLHNLPFIIGDSVNDLEVSQEVDLYRKPTSILRRY